MPFREALTTVLQTDSRQQTTDAFYLYSRLGDLCASSYEDTRKNKLFFELNKRLNIVKNIFQDGKLAIPILKLAYPAVKHLLIQSSFINLIDCVAQAAGIVDPPLQKPTTSGQKCSKNARPASQNTTQATLYTPSRTQKSISQMAQPSSPVVTRPKAGGRKKIIRKSSKKWWIAASIVAFVAIATTLLVVFGSKITWTGWQYVIGCFGGLSLTMLMTCILYLLDDNSICSYDWIGTVIVIVFAIANFLAKWFVGDNYKIIFIWVCSYLLLDSLLLSVCCIYVGSVWTFVDWIVCGATIASLVCGLRFF